MNVLDLYDIVLVVLKQYSGTEHVYSYAELIYVARLPIYNTHTVYDKTVEGENLHGFCSIAKVFPSNISLD